MPRNATTPLFHEQEANAVKPSAVEATTCQLRTIFVQVYFSTGEPLGDSGREIDQGDQEGEKLGYGIRLETSAFREFVSQHLITHFSVPGRSIAKGYVRKLLYTW